MENSNLTFGAALEALKQSKKVCRKGWNGKGMWLRCIDPIFDMKISDNQSDKVTEGNTLAPYVALKTADNQFVPWLPSQTDILAEDWEIIKD